MSILINVKELFGSSHRRRAVIRDILTHLGLWLIRSRPPPKIHDPPNIEYASAFGGDMLRKPAGSATCPRNEHTDIIYGDPEYSWNDYIQL
jgi:hypothetical protein